MLKNNKRKMLLLSLVVVLLIGVGTTVAYILDQPENVVNTFEPSEVTCVINEGFDGVVKNNVTVTNTSDIDAYIRAEVIVNWQNSEGEVYGKQLIEGTDYTIKYNLADGWVYNENDGFYYYTKVVSPTAPDNVTTVLIEECAPVEGTAPDGYFLSVEILASAVQAHGVSDGVPTGVDGQSAAQSAWGVDPSTLA